MNNIPAFPTITEQDYKQGKEHRIEITEGMTLRDYFAGQALAGCCAQNNINVINDTAIAKYAYDIAEEMIKRRVK